jgi:pimeloyl-ACP methyl ester carboxylesterase
MKKIFALGLAVLVMFGCSLGGRGEEREKGVTGPSAGASDVTRCHTEDPPADTFILVHGAWHGAWCWFQTEHALKEKGFNVVTFDLPAHGGDQTPPGLVTLDSYVGTLVNVIDGRSGKVILVGHSAGGIVISQAAELRPEKIKGLVYVAAFLLPNGATLLDTALQDAGSVAGQNLIINQELGSLDIEPGAVKDAFYNKTDDALAAYAMALLRPEPIVPFLTPLQLSGNFEGLKKYYIKTKYDQAVTPWLQDRMLTNTAVDKIYSIKSDHSPFFSRNGKLVRILADIADRLNEK